MKITDEYLSNMNKKVETARPMAKNVAKKKEFGLR